MEYDSRPIKCLHLLIPIFTQEMLFLLQLKLWIVTPVPMIWTKKNPVVCKQGASKNSTQKVSSTALTKMQRFMKWIRGILQNKNKTFQNKSSDKQKHFTDDVEEKKMWQFHCHMSTFLDENKYFRLLVFLMNMVNSFLYSCLENTVLIAHFCDY